MVILFKHVIINIIIIIIIIIIIWFDGSLSLAAV